jgi:hypothetical protein
MPLAGTQMQGRDIARLLHDAGWTDAENLTVAVMVCFAESMGYSRAYNDNVDSSGKVTSRDVGLMQINISASQIGTAAEEDLYDVQKNADAAYALYKNRGFQPWVAYNSRVYLRDTYLKLATRGIANFLAEVQLGKPTDTLRGQPYTHNIDVPVVDYQYRVNSQHQVITEQRDAVARAQRLTRLTDILAALKPIHTALANAANLYKQ